MASPETVAHGQCGACTKPVAVKKNRGNLAYYRCDFCGFEGRHHWNKTSDAYLRGLGAEPVPADPAAAQAPAPAVTVKTGKTPVKTAPPAPAPRERSTFFS